MEKSSGIRISSLDREFFFNRIRIVDLKAREYCTGLSREEIRHLIAARIVQELRTLCIPYDRGFEKYASRYIMS